MKWKTYICQLLPVLVFACFLFGLTAYGLGTEEKTYSSTEKRELQTMPKLKAKSIKNGKFQKKYETYLSDQFPARDSWVQLQTNVSRAFGKSESNGVYFGADDYLLEHYETEDFEGAQIEKNLTALGAFAARTALERNIAVMLVPTKTWLLQDKLPAFAPTYDEQNMYDFLEEQLGVLAENVLVPVTQALQAHTDEQLYYRTDHHWTTRGAWYGYLAYVQATDGDLQRAQEKSALATVSETFRGTTYAKIHQAPRADVIEAYQPKQQLAVTYNLGQKESDSLYDETFLGSDDEYSYFTGGNQPIIEVRGGEKNGKILLIIKDSFANCMVPFLAEDYETLVMVDLRQLNMDCDALIQRFAPTDVLVLYNTAQLAKDRDFALKCGAD